ncbi:hypothetical protein C8R47DRAFT_1082433 [Mycena vitilis]|nr:hypothetical protein C8R47DRAFT_1082433 [Mycena vitilis]
MLGSSGRAQDSQLVIFFCHLRIHDFQEVENMGARSVLPELEAEASGGLFLFAGMLVLVMHEVPQELIDSIIDELADDWAIDWDKSKLALGTCSLVTRRWTYRSQKRLFEDVVSTSLGESTKLAALLSSSPHLATYIVTLRLGFTTADIALRVDGAAGILHAIFAGLVCLRNLELLVAWRSGDAADLGRENNSYAFPSLLGSCLQGISGPPRSMSLGFVNWQFEDIHSFASVVAAASHLESLVLHDCQFASLELTAMPQIQLKSIAQLHLVGVRPELLQWIARAQIQVTALRVGTELYHDEYLVGLRDNHLDLSVQDICLAVNLYCNGEESMSLPTLEGFSTYSSIRLEINAWGLVFDNDHPQFIHQFERSLEQSLSSFPRPSGSRSQLILDIRSCSADNSPLWKLIDDMLTSKKFNLKIHSRRLSAAASEEQLEYFLS